MHGFWVFPKAKASDGLEQAAEGIGIWDVIISNGEQNIHMSELPKIKLNCDFYCFTQVGIFFFFNRSF